MTKYNVIKAETERRAMNSYRLAVFKASMQCTTEVGAVSRGTPRSVKFSTVRINEVVFDVEKVLAMGGSRPSVRNGQC